jgi:outer membrane lipoprotein-sorting protein
VSLFVLLSPGLNQVTCLALVIAGVLLLNPVQAQKKPDAPDASAASGRDPAAVALRDRVVRTYHDIRAIHERVTQRQWKSDPADALTIDIELRYRKPNRLYLSIDYPYVDKPGRWRLIYACDGKTLTVYNGAYNEYETAKSPARLDRLILPKSLRGPEFIALLRDVSPFEDLEKSAIVRYSEALEETAEGAWHTLRVELQQDGARRTLRYRIGSKDSLIHGLTLSIVPDASSANPFADPEVRSNVDSAYTLVNTDPHFSDVDFHFTPPPGAKERKSERARPADGPPADRDGSDGRLQ